MIPVKLLLVDDDTVLTRVLDQALTRGGMKVHVAKSGGEAMTRVRAEEYDAVVIDWVLPEVDGITLIRSIRATTEMVPFLVMTSALSIPDARARARLRGGHVPRQAGGRQRAAPHPRCRRQRAEEAERERDQLVSGLAWRESPPDAADCRDRDGAGGPRARGEVPVPEGRALGGPSGGGRRAPSGADDRSGGLGPVGDHDGGRSHGGPGAHRRRDAPGPPRGGDQHRDGGDEVALRTAGLCADRGATEKTGARGSHLVRESARRRPHPLREGAGNAAHRRARGADQRKRGGQRRAPRGGHGPRPGRVERRRRAHPTRRHAAHGDGGRTAAELWSQGADRSVAPQR